MCYHEEIKALYKLQGSGFNEKGNARELKGGIRNHRIACRSSNTISARGGERLIVVSCLSFSMNTNVNTVCGLSTSQCHDAWEIRQPTYVNLNHAGVHPRKRNWGPSSRSPARRTCNRPCNHFNVNTCSSLPTRYVQQNVTSFPALDCKRLLRTSAGAQRVVAMVPAARDAAAWVLVSSFWPAEVMRYCFAAAYLDRSLNLDREYRSSSYVLRRDL